MKSLGKASLASFDPGQSWQTICFFAFPFQFWPRPTPARPGQAGPVAAASPFFFYPLVNPEILTAARILVGIEFIQASTNSSICDPGRKVLILPVIVGGRASLIPPEIKGGIPPGFPGGIVGIPPGIQGRIGGIPPRIPGGIGGISPGINGGIPPGTFHNPGRDLSWDPARKGGIPPGMNMGSQVGLAGSRI